MERHVHSAHEHLFFIGYIVIGGFLILANSLILLAITCTPKLRSRKEFVLIAGLCSVDLLVCFGYILTAKFRLSLSKDYPPLVPRFYCSYHVFHHLIAIGYPLVGATCVVQAVDRLFAIRAPIIYSRWTTKYALTVVFVPILLSTIGMGINVGLTRNSLDLIDSFCYISDALSPVYGRIIGVVRMASCLTAILLYADFYLRLRTRFQNLSTTLQSRITITIGFTTLNAFAFMFIPDLIVLCDFAELRTRYAVVFYIAVLVKLSLDFAILFSRHDELRKAIKKILVPWRERAMRPWRKLSQQAASKFHLGPSSRPSSEEVFL